MKVLIVEDEVLAANRLQKLLTKIVPSIEVLAVLDTVKSVVDWYENNEKPELNFFDIQLADGLSFEVFEQIRVTNPVIFTTAYDEYAIKAFEVNSIDYLLKPIAEVKLEKAISKFKTLTQDSVIPVDQLKALLQQTKTKEYKERFVVKIGEHLKNIKIADVTCFFSLEGATYLETKGHKKILIDFSMDQLMDLVNPKLFFRINRKYILHLDSIKDIVTFSNSRLKIYLENDQHNELIVARDRVGEFKSWLDR